MKADWTRVVYDDAYSVLKYMGNHCSSSLKCSADSVLNLILLAVELLMHCVASEKVSA